MKTKTLLTLFSIAICAVLAVIACSKDIESSNVNRLTLDVSTKYQYNFATSEMATLGRVLFYDQSLSVNNAVSCGSCHKQQLAFADEGRFSSGFENKKTDRNTPPIQNLFSSMLIGPGASAGQALFWDGRERIVETMVMQPMFNHVEMGMRNPTEVVKKVKSKSYYPELFAEAFGDNEIDIKRISEALGSFVRSISSNSSPFDRNQFGSSTGNMLSADQQKGLELFFGKYNCGSCHQLFSPVGYNSGLEGSELLNIGLDQSYTDKGRGAITGNQEDNGKFKIPNLRNVALTAPYMHDGRFETLREVINHYSTGVKPNANLDFRLKDANGMPLVLNITETEKDQLIAFLHSLTDNQLTTDPKFSDPFKKR